jgi:hypothetical protein
MKGVNDKQTIPCRTVLTHHSLPWSTAKPVVVKVTLPREPWAKPTKEEKDG